MRIFIAGILFCMLSSIAIAVDFDQELLNTRKAIPGYTKSSQQKNIIPTGNANFDMDEEIQKLKKYAPEESRLQPALMLKQKGANTIIMPPKEYKDIKPFFIKFNISSPGRRLMSMCADLDLKVYKFVTIGTGIEQFDRSLSDAQMYYSGSYKATAQTFFVGFFPSYSDGDNMYIKLKYFNLLLTHQYTPQIPGDVFTVDKSVPVFEIVAGILSPMTSFLYADLNLAYQPKRIKINVTNGLFSDNAEKVIQDDILFFWMGFCF